MGRKNQHAALRRQWRLDGTYERLLLAQNGRCGICQRAIREDETFDLDHDHVADSVRGLLCRGDNLRLGRERNPDWLHAACRYLLRHQLAEAGRLRWVEEDRGYLTPCWIWQRAIASTGYGVLNINGETEYVHRIMCGMIPTGYQVDHLCAVRSCVNPAHLEAVTSKENNRRARGNPTHCQRGHEWTHANTYITPQGTRQCRACIKGRQQAAAYLRRTAGER